MRRSDERNQDAGQARAGAGARHRRRDLTPLQRALALLARREYSRQALACRLQRQGVTPEDAAVAIDRLAAAGWQDDARFADALIRHRAESGYGPVYIRAELATHGLPADWVDSALAGYADEWVASACQLLRRRHPQALRGDRQAQRRAADFLLRRGFEMAQIRAALAAMQEAQDG